MNYAPSLARRFAARDGTSGDTDIGNVQNSQYVANITVGGGDFTVILDTGSSDLWVTGNIANSTDTGTPASINYAIGRASGNVHTAPVVFSDFSVSSQAFIDVQNSSSFGAIAALGIDGLAGLGPGFSSIVRNTVGAGVGDTLLDNVFQLNKTTSNFITFLLSRNGVLNAQSVQGEFTISEIISGYESVTSQPKLPVAELKNSSRTDQHWTTLLNSITAPKGELIELESIVKHTADGKLVTVLDSGFTLPQVPRHVADAIYGVVEGAEYDTSNGWWVIPCQQELNVSVNFGGINYPVHPLDISSSDFGGKFSNGSVACVGTFQPISTAFSLGGEFDTIMGEAFLRNTYTLLNWGDFVDDVSAPRDSPYVQLLSTTNAAQAHKEFVDTRLGGVDITAEPRFKFLKNGKKSPVPDGERVQHLEGLAYRNRAAIAAGTVGGFILLVLLSIFCYCRRRRAARRARGMQQIGSTSTLVGGHERYRSMSDPRSAPPGAMPMQNMQGGYQGGYRDPYYQNP